MFRTVALPLCVPSLNGGFFDGQSVSQLYLTLVCTIAEKSVFKANLDQQKKSITKSKKKKVSMIDKHRKVKG